MNMSLKRLEANRANARKSTGPRTAAGREVSKMNGLKHRIFSKEVVAQGNCTGERLREFRALHQRFLEELQPEGAVEEMLVDQIVTAHWRLRRALAAESGEIAVSVNGGKRHRESGYLRKALHRWEAEPEPDFVMSESALGNQLIANQLTKVFASVESEGELTEEVIGEVKFRGKAYGLTRELQQLRLNLQKNPEGLSAEEVREWRKQQALAYVNKELSIRLRQRSECAKREMMEEAALQAAEVLPSAETLEKIQRYETKLERQMFRAMAQLERLQRMRRGETVPAPVSVAVS
jgi:hypothetical protein